MHKSACLPLLFPCLLNATKIYERLALRFRRRHTVRNVIVDGELKMRFELGFEIGVERTFGEERPYACAQPLDRAHGWPGSSSAAGPKANMLSITLVRRCQSRASLASWRLPELVME